MRKGWRYTSRTKRKRKQILDVHDCGSAGGPGRCYQIREKTEVKRVVEGVVGCEKKMSEAWSKKEKTGGVGRQWRKPENRACLPVLA